MMDQCPGEPVPHGGAGLGYAPPRTYEELRAVLASASVRFPRQLRQVAAFVAQFPSEVAVGNTVAIARRARVQPSTLVRFAQHLGFPGFSDLQELFKRYVMANWPNLPVEPGPPRLEDAHGPDLRTLAGLAQASMTSLARLPGSLDAAMFEAFIATMAEADVVYLVGNKRAFPVALYAALALSQLGIRNVLVDNLGSTAFEQLAFVSPRDAVVAISFSPYNSITPALAARAAQAGAAVLALTDLASSPLVPSSRAWLAIEEPDFGGFRSLATTLAVSLSLVLGVAGRRGAAGAVTRGGPPGP